MTTLCLVETDAAGVVEASLRALAFARSTAGPSGTVAAVVFGEAGDVPVDALAGYGASAVYAIGPGDVAGYAPVAWARSLDGLAQQEGAVAVLAAATDRGNEVMAHLGAVAGLPMAANCLRAQPVATGEWRVTRQRWGGLLLEDALLEAPIALLTVATDAAGIPATAEPDGAAGLAAEHPDSSSANAGASDTPATSGGPTAPVPVHAFHPDLADGDLSVRATEAPAQAGGASLATARVVVGGGRGVGGPEGFAPLEELASLLGGVVGVSRVVTSEGWRPHRQQVGQTGTRITPQVYLACGISGAIQHMAGCAGAKHIVAVNTDPGAPIVAHADYAVIGDIKQVIPALIAAIQARTPPR